jgi:large subunit ribosomal protein L10
MVVYLLTPHTLMAISRQKKEVLLERVNGITGKPSVVFVNFHGLSVGNTSDMRAKLRDAEVDYFVTKKTLVKKAFTESDIEGELPQLDGELAVAYAEEPTAAAREIYGFQKEYGDKITILGGVFENRFLNRAEMEEIAQIPSIDVLRGMFVNVINSPIQGLVLALNAVAEKKA